MNEDFVPFLLAKKLKEKGFKEKCYAYYFPVNNELCYNINQFRGGNLYDCLYSHNSLPKELVASDFIDAPTISRVLKWLREEKEVDLVIEPIFIYDENKHREYGVRVFAPQLNKPVNCGYFNMWNDASIAGIKYCLENLI